jgi:hypothetical protein
VEGEGEPAHEGGVDGVAAVVEEEAEGGRGARPPRVLPVHVVERRVDKDADGAQEGREPCEGGGHRAHVWREGVRERGHAHLAHEAGQGDGVGPAVIEFVRVEVEAVG